MIMARPDRLVEHVLDEGRAQRAPRQAVERLDLDADRESADPHAPLAGVVTGLAAAAITAFGFEIAREIRGVDFGLEADQIVMAQAPR